MIWMGFSGKGMEWNMIHDNLAVFGMEYDPIIIDD